MVQCFKGTLRGRQILDLSMNLMISNVWSCLECLRSLSLSLICGLFRSQHLLRDSIHSSVEEQVAMFLHVVGHNQRFRVLKFTFRRSTETISRYFHEVLSAIGELRTEMITPPSTSVHPKIHVSRRWYPYFKVLSIPFRIAQ